MKVTTATASARISARCRSSIDPAIQTNCFTAFERTASKTVLQAILWIATFHLQIQFVVSFPMVPFQPRTSKNLGNTVRGDSLNGFSSSPLSSNPDYRHVKGIIFDLDGTLIDSWRLGFDATQIILKKHGIDLITEQLYHECTKYATPERLARHAGLEPGDAQFKTVGQALADEFDELYVGLVTTQTAGFFPGIGSLLRKLQSKDVVLGALTNACVAYAHAVLKVNSEALSYASSSSSSSTDTLDTSIYSSFPSIRGADNVPAAKPAPDGLLQVCQDLGLSPESCVYIGDSPSDAVAASAAGMPSIGVLWGSHTEDNLRKAPFSHLCRTVDELELLLL